MRIAYVVGARPNFVKMAPVISELRLRMPEGRHALIHTGQHYDRMMSEVFLEELGVPAPDHMLGVGSATHAVQTARVMERIEPVLEAERPDLLIVPGDVNSTLAATLVAVKLGIPVAHLESGLRSFDRTMPEELNRVLTDHASTLLLCPSESAAAHLRREGVSGHMEVVGDVMVDVAAAVQPRARQRLDLLEPYSLKPRQYVVATAHRAGNVDDPERLTELVDVLTAVPMPVVAAVHPRTRKRLEDAGLIRRLEAAEQVTLAPPLGYVELAALVCNARAVMTDSGGLQKEAYLAGVPCVTLRRVTEWTETVEQGWNVLVDLDRDQALAALERQPPSDRPALYGDGHAGERVVSALTLHAS